MKTIVYCAIHKRTLVNEVLYSILNVAEVCCDIENYRFVVITDMPEEFKLVASIVKMRLGMPIIIEPISKAITENWLGPYRYVYRLYWFEECGHHYCQCGYFRAARQVYTSQHPGSHQHPALWLSDGEKSEGLPVYRHHHLYLDWYSDGRNPVL